MAGRGADHAQTAGEPDRQLATDTHRLSRSAAPTPGRDRERLDSVAQRRSRRAGLLRARDRAHTSTTTPERRKGSVRRRATRSQPRTAPGGRPSRRVSVRGLAAPTARAAPPDQAGRRPAASAGRSRATPREERPAQSGHASCRLPARPPPLARSCPRQHEDRLLAHHARSLQTATAPGRGDSCRNQYHAPHPAVTPRYGPCRCSMLLTPSGRAEHGVA
jgi:hypothetical protein